MSRSNSGSIERPDGGTEIVAEYGDEKSITRAVLEGIAAFEECSERDLEPLYERIDPNALDKLLHHAQNKGRSLTVSFTMGEYTVFVQSNEEVRITSDPPPEHLERNNQ